MHDKNNRKKVSPRISSIVSVCVVVLASHSLFAQQAIIKGKITHHAAGIPFASIELKGIDNINYQQYAWSDSLGIYQLKALQNSNYIVKVSYLGFKEFVSDTIRIGSTQKEFVLNIFLEERPEGLKEVTITSKRRILEAEKGKLTFNVQNSALTTGQTALDMLKKLPGVTVGQNDEILFRGATGVNVMIEGKMTYLSGSQLANYLKGMGAEDLDKIELITTPTSEFDASGNAGIINIIPKKSLKKGYAVDIRSAISYGKFWMTNQNISASLRGDKLSLYGSFDYNTPHRAWDNKTSNTINDNRTLIKLIKDYERAYKIKYYTRRAGVEWQFLSKHKIAAAYHGYLDDFKSYNNTRLNRINSSGALHSYLHSENDIQEPYHYDAASVNYQFNIDDAGKIISADANYTSYRNFSDGLMIARNYTPNGSFQNEYQQKSHQPGFIKISSFKADIDLPYEKFRIKAGVKYAEVENDNQFRFDSLQAGRFVEIVNMSNHFQYKERIAAAYASGSRVFGKTSAEAGLRVEHTNANGYTVKQDISNKWQYIKLFPSIAVGRIINNNNKLDISIGKRINRPSYSNLNPVRWYYDPYFYYSGNPDLIPELAWVSSLTYSLQNKYIFSASYNQGLNHINRKLIIDDNGVSIKSQSANFGKRHRLDFTISVPLKPLPFWDIQFFSDASYTSYPISQIRGDKTIKQWAIVTSLQQDFSLPRDFGMNITAYFYSSELRGIYLTEPAGYVDVGIRKTFMNKKLIAQLSVGDIFNTNRYRAYSQSDITDHYYDDKLYTRIIGLSMKYHFGGELLRSSQKKTEEQERL